LYRTVSSSEIHKLLSLELIHRLFIDPGSTQAVAAIEACPEWGRRPSARN